MTDDPVNHPPHYTKHPSGVECITITEHMGFNVGNAVKYLWQADLKGDALEDLRKAAWYIDREIARRYGSPDETGSTLCARCLHPTSWHWLADPTAFNEQISTYRCIGHPPGTAGATLEDCPCREPRRVVNPHYAGEDPVEEQNCLWCRHRSALHGPDGCSYVTAVGSGDGPDHPCRCEVIP